MKPGGSSARNTERVVILVAAVLIVLAATGAAGLRINVSESLPLGVYRTTSERVARGQTVLLCPSPTPIFMEARKRGYFAPGFCPGQSDYLMKRVWGLPGDRVTVESEGVWINGERVPNSAQLAFDQAGRPLPSYRALNLVLPPEQYLLLSELHPRSFDGRYFGPVERKQIVAVIRPLFVWQSQRRT